MHLCVFVICIEAVCFGGHIIWCSGVTYGFALRKPPDGLGRSIWDAGNETQVNCIQSKFLNHFIVTLAPVFVCLFSRKRLW